MPNTKTQYAGGKTKRFFKAFSTGRTKTKISVKNAASQKTKLHASAQKLKGIESQVKRTKKAANTHIETKAKLKTVEAEIKRLESQGIKSNKYYDLKAQRSRLRQEFKKSKGAYYEHAKLSMLRGRANMEVNKRKKTVKAYEKAAAKLALEQFNKKRWVTGWDKKYKKASVADVHKFINIDGKLDTIKTISDSEGKPVKKLLKQFELDDFRMHPDRAKEVIDSFPGVKEYSAEIGINIDGLHENQKAMLAHKMIEITKNPDITERAMATEMVKSVVVTKFTSPEIKVDLMGYVAPRLYNPGASSTDNIGPNAMTVSSRISSGANHQYLKINNALSAESNTDSGHEYLEPKPVNQFAGYELVQEKAKPYGNVVYSTASAKEGPHYNTASATQVDPIYNFASAGPAEKQGPTYNNPANLQALAKKSETANPERTGTIQLKAGPYNSTPNTEEIYANMTATGPSIYSNPN